MTSAMNKPAPSPASGPPAGWHRFALDDITLDLPADRLTPRLRQVLRSGRYERLERQMLARLAAECDGPALDIGGGAGATGIVLARHLGPERVTIYEPDPQMAAVIRHNLALNGQTGAQVRTGAVIAGRGREPIAFRRGPAFWSSAAPEWAGAGETMEVPAFGIETLLAEARPELVALDVEGMEIELAAPLAAAGPRFVLMELHRRRYGLSGIARIFGDMLAGGFAYRPDVSRGAVVGFERLG